MEKGWLFLLGEKGWLDRDSLVHGPETHSKEDKMENEAVTKIQRESH